MKPCPESPRSLRCLRIAALKTGITQSWDMPLMQPPFGLHVRADYVRGNPARV
jgi:hypothetical protein